MAGDAVVQLFALWYAYHPLLINCLYGPEH